jgi:hypothetical protein
MYDDVYCLFVIFVCILCLAVPAPTLFAVFGLGMALLAWRSARPRPSPVAADQHRDVAEG